MPIGVSHLVCGYSDRYQARKTPSHQNKRKPKMNKNDTLPSLFKTLTDILPHEYGEHLTKDTECITITKKDSTIVVYITENETEPGILDAASYDTKEELSPDATIHLDIMDPDFNIIDAINEIKQLF